MKRIKVSNLFLIILLISLFSYQDFYAQYKIGFSQCSTEHEWRKSQIRDMQIESAFYPDMKLIIKDAENRSDIQIKQIEDFINEGVNLLIISANESEALTPVIEKAFRSGIPIILLERLINSDSYTAYIGSNNYNTGREAARYANKLLGGQGDIIEITGWFKTSSAIERQRGFNDEISNYPKINIIKSIDGEWNYDKSESEISNILKSGLSFDLVYAHNDMMALGALKAIKNRGIESRPYILGIDGLTGELGGMQAVLNKDIDATFLYPTGGALAIKTANDILRKQPFKRQNILETLVIDSTNVKILKLLNDQMESFQQNLEIQSSNLSFQISKQRSQELVLILVVFCLMLIIVLIIVIYRNFQDKVKVHLNLKTIYNVIEKQNHRIVTENKKLICFQNELEKTLNAKLSFFTIVSHEFKTPLTLVKGPLENLMNKKIFTKQEQHLFKLIYKNTLRLLQLVNQLMDLRKIERKKLELFPTKINLIDFFRNTVDSFIPLTSQRNIEIKSEYINEDIEVLVDIEKIQKAVYAILTNFLSRAQDGGRINIRIREVSLSSKFSNIDEILIEITDNSTGMNQEQLDTIFDAFDTNLTKTDLGLNLAKEFIEIHGGRITVISDKGKGVFFEIFLPNINESGFIGLNEFESSRQMGALADFQKDFQVINSAECPIPVKPQARSSDLPIILIVDDVVDVREFIKLSLVEKYIIVEAENGVEALNIINEEEPDLIISDVMMPKMDGMELTRSLKMDIRTSHIPIILLTAWGELENKLDGLEGGADAYILKPFSSKHLQVRVSKLLELRLKLVEYYRNTSMLEFDIEGNGLNKMDNKFLSQLKMIIDSSIDNDHLSIEELGKKMGMSRTYLYRKIKKLTNMSVSEFIITVKLKKSLELLRNSGKTVAEIAFEVGFTSASYYTRCFKDVFMMTPSEYIKKNKKTNEI